MSNGGFFTTVNILRHGKHPELYLENSKKTYIAIILRIISGLLLNVIDNSIDNAKYQGKR